MSLHSIIEHRANYYFLKLEEDYVEICQGKHKHCKAAILSILENWMNSKRATTSRESDLYVYLSYPQFVKQMFGLYERSTVITSLKELEQEGLILKRPFRDIFNQVTFEYRLNCPVVQQELSKLSDKPSTVGGLNLNGGSVEINGGSYENKRGGDVNLNGGSFKNKRNIEPTIEPDIEPTENTEREEVADATARSQPSSQMIVDEQTVPVTYADCVAYLQQRGIALESDAVQVMVTARNLYVRQYPHATLPPLDDEDTVKKEVVDGDTHQHPAMDRDLPARSEQPLPRSDSKRDTNKITAPPAPRKPRANSTLPQRSRQQGLMDTKPEPEIPEKAVIIMDRWDSIHRKPIPRTPKTIQAAQLLMVYDPSEDDLRDCEKWLYTTDRPGKPWYRSHGVHLPDIAEKIGSWQSLQNAPPAKPNKEESNEHKTANFYSAQSVMERNKWKMEAFQAEYEAKTAAMQEVQS